MKKIYLITIALLIISNIMAFRKAAHYKSILKQHTPLINEINNKIRVFYNDYIDICEKADIKFGGNDELQNNVQENSESSE